ncbi:hypothetical protein CCMA1212_006995 [Trichoderma ghanense]|uniref:SSCRP protein n=1 Tax=Trichoderma ghanense TaxID=65468 RepID=A0ABY2GZJ3_9HYPO
MRMNAGEPQCLCEPRRRSALRMRNAVSRGDSARTCDDPISLPRICCWCGSAAGKGGHGRASGERADARSNAHGTDYQKACRCWG